MSLIYPAVVSGWSITELERICCQEGTDNRYSERWMISERSRDMCQLLGES